MRKPVRSHLRHVQVKPHVVLPGVGCPRCHRHALEWDNRELGLVYCTECGAEYGFDPCQGGLQHLEGLDGLLYEEG